MRTLKMFATAILVFPLLAACATFSTPAKLGGHDITNLKKVLSVSICPDDQNGISAELKTKGDELGVVFFEFEKETFAAFLEQREERKLFIQKGSDWQEVSSEKGEKVMVKVMKAAESCLEDTFKNFKPGF